MSEFFYMGGFGAYIWSAMAVALFLMLVEPIMLIIKRGSVLADIKRIKRLEERKNRK
ncbi:MAG: heme exporter protein CcmD [Cocleimonas sp.]